MVELPDTLHHYTTAAGLLGITDQVKLGPLSEDAHVMGTISRIRSISLWATDARYLNDSAELAYAAEQLASRIEALVVPGAAREASLRNAAERIRKLDFTGSGYAEGMPHTAYVTSFCRKGDLLSQWRGYGVHGGGYSIELRSSALSQITTPIGRVGDESVGYVTGAAFVHKVAYGLDATRIEEAAQSIVDGRSGSGVMVDAVGALAQFKDPAFKEEDEWRLVVPAGTFYQACRYRTTPAGMIVPYIQVHRFQEDPNNPFVARSAIKSVTVGPGPDRKLRKESVLQLLRQRGFSDVEVHSSDVPFRG
ncbi:DUF2971 domain-containing protein [Rhodococcus sp. NPDC127528]|uniref:DUF2971 domain-containing protein n=1 Tax=unclassified Rhodococcus (in: high G+C Gram-positive bacteria) TaxID=192944 RepID=UPI00362A135F